MKRRIITVLGMILTIIMMSALYCNVFAAETIDKVEFNGFKAPEYNAAASHFNLMTKDGKVYMDGSSANWMKIKEDESREVVSSKSVFDEGIYVYNFKVTVDTTTGYEFADPCEVIVNGESWGEVTPQVKGDIAYLQLDSPEYTIGHNYVYDSTDPAKFEEAGKIWEKCDRCGDMRYDEIPAITDINVAEAVYDGTVKAPEVAVYDSEGAVVPADSYVVNYPEGIVNAGAYGIKISFSGNYAGTVDCDFTVKKAPIDVTGIKWVYSKALAYTGKVKTVKLSSQPDAELATVEVAGNTGSKVGTYKATAVITPVDEANYEVVGAVAPLTWKIVPAKAYVAKNTAGSKKLTVKMSKKASAYGGSVFQIAYKVKGTSKWKYTTTTAQSKTIKKLKSGKAYNVKVRAYKTVNSKKHYGAWSKVYTSGKIK